MLIVNGAYRGQEARLEDIHQDTFCVDVTLLTVGFESFPSLAFSDHSRHLGFDDSQSTEQHGLRRCVEVSRLGLAVPTVVVVFCHLSVHIRVLERRRLF